MSDDYVSILDLDKEQMQKLLQGINYLHGHLMDGDEIESSSETAFIAQPFTTITGVVKDDRAIDKTEVTSSTSKVTLMRNGINKVESELTTSFSASLSGYYSQEKTENEEKNSEHSYSFCCLDARKGVINLNKFRKVNENLLKYFDGKQIDKNSVNSFLKKFGCYVFNDVIVGGKLYDIETTNKNSTSSSIENKTTSGGKAEGNLYGQGLSVKNDNENTNKNTNDKSNSVSITKKQNKGGDSKYVGDKEAWKKSLDNYKTWDIIEVKSLKTTIDLLPNNILEEIKNKFISIPVVKMSYKTFLPCKEEEYFNIKCKKDDLFVNYDNKNNLTFDNCGHSDGFHFKVKCAGKGDVYLINPIKNMHMTDTGNEIKNQAHDGSDKQKWYFEKYKDTNYFKIVNVNTQKVLGLKDSKVGTALLSFTTAARDELAFRFEKKFNMNDLGSVNNWENVNWVYIKCKKSGLHLRGDSLQQDHLHKNADEFKWLYSAGFFMNKKSKQVIDNYGTHSMFKTSASNGNSIGMYKCNSQSNQKWYFEQSSNRDYYHVINSWAKMCLDNKASSTAGTGMHLWSKVEGNENQMFKVEKVI